MSFLWAGEMADVTSNAVNQKDDEFLGKLPSNLRRAAEAGRYCYKFPLRNISGLAFRKIEKELPPLGYTVGIIEEQLAGEPDKVYISWEAAA